MQAQQPLENFAEFLKTKGLKTTRQRKLVMNKALGMRGHFNADDLWMKAHKKDERVSKATVYRTLQLLTQSRLIEPRDFEQGKLYYEPMVGHTHHDHLICLECGKITEFENAEIEDIQDKIAKKYSFTMAAHSHKLYGTCLRCRQGKTNKKEHEFRIKF